ncbi:hypothetical protein AYO49_03195 [Verrucomicrobiaceae bacterium SCGC AG-212-N21]|nr:hypothetical protein AYO49_03195 [Verrucomicrobiaceae bacterium SCGC AG-212-N21]
MDTAAYTWLKGGDMKTLSRRRKWGVIATTLVLLGLAAAYFSRPFSYFEVCDRCGATRSSTDWFVPFTDREAFSDSSEPASPLSRVLLANGIVAAHDHHWLFGQGRGHGFSCAIGPGRHLAPAAASKDFAQLIQALHSHGLIALRDRVLSGALDPETSRHFFSHLAFDVPTIPTKQELEAWTRERLENVDDIVGISKQE